MVIRLHKKARAIPEIRRETQTSDLPDTVPAEKHGVPRRTIRKWRKRDSVEEASHRPRRIPVCVRARTGRHARRSSIGLGRRTDRRQRQPRMNANEREEGEGAGDRVSVEPARGKEDQPPWQPMLIVRSQLCGWELVRGIRDRSRFRRGERSQSDCRHVRDQYTKQPESAASQ